MADDKTKTLTAFAEDPSKTQTDGDTVKRLNTMKKAAVQMRSRYDAAWMQNFGFFAGNQYESYETDVRQFLNTRKVPMYTPSSKVKIVANKILSMCWQQASYINQNFPEATAFPPNSSEEWAVKAEIATDVLRARQYLDNETQQRIYDLLWLFGTGRIWILTHWDADASYKGLDGTEIQGVGDVKRTTLNPFKTYQSPWVDSTGECPWVIVSDVMPIDEINEAYGLTGEKKIQPEELAENIGNLDALMQSVVQGTAAPAKRKDAAIHNVLYHRPTPAYPKGQMFAWAGDTLLQSPANLPDERFMLVSLDWTPIPGANYPMPYIQPMIGLQKELNFSLSQIRELANRQLRGDYKYTGAKPVSELQKPIDIYRDEATGAKAYRVEPGVGEFEFLTYDMNDNNGKYVVSMMTDSLLDVGSLHDQSMGKANGANETATTTLALKESDMSGSSLHRDILADAYCKVDVNKLWCTAKHVLIPRAMRNTGRDGNVSEFIMSGSDIEGIDDVRVVPTPMMTDAQRRQLLDQLSTEKCFGPFEGDPNTLAYWEDMQAKVERAISSGIPNMDLRVENAIKPLTIEDLRDFVGKLRKMAIENILNPPQPEPQAQPGMPGQVPTLMSGGDANGMQGQVMQGQRQ